MNKELQRIKIAEACGWREIQNGDAWGTPIGIPLTMPKKDNWRNMDGFFELPDYLNDLNAMHEAVMFLPEKTKLAFRKELQYMIAPRTRPSGIGGIVLMSAEDYDNWFHATAAQRAEAFLRTLNLWEE